MPGSTAKDGTIEPFFEAPKRSQRFQQRARQKTGAPGVLPAQVLPTPHRYRRHVTRGNLIFYLICGISFSTPSMSKVDFRPVEKVEPFFKAKTHPTFSEARGSAPENGGGGGTPGSCPPNP